MQNIKLFLKFKEFQYHILFILLFEFSNLRFFQKQVSFFLLFLRSLYLFEHFVSFGLPFHSKIQNIWRILKIKKL